MMQEDETYPSNRTIGLSGYVFYLIEENESEDRTCTVGI